MIGIMARAFRFLTLSLIAILALPVSIFAANSSFSEGYQLMQNSMFEDAAVKFQESLRQEPNNLSAMSSLAMCLEKLKRYDDAIQVWRRYDQMKPSGKILYEHIALIGQMKAIAPALQKGDIGSVMPALNQILKDPFKDSIITLDAATALAHAYYSQNKFSEAYSVYNQLITRYPVYLMDDVGVYEYAKLLTSIEKKYLEAVTYLKELSSRAKLTLNRDDIIDLIAENYKNEAERIEKSSDKDKDKKARLLYEKIVLECSTSKYADIARSKVGNIVQSVENLKENADLLYKEERYAEALLLYQRLASNSNNPNIIQYAMFQTAQCISTQGKYGEAVKLFHEAVRKYPEGEYSDDCLLRAACLLGGLMGKPELALKEWGILIERYPDSEYIDEAYFDIGIIYKRSLKDYRKAVKAFQKVIKDYPESPWVNLAKHEIMEMQQGGK